MPLSTLKYTNGEITVVWKPDSCIHSRICWTQLKQVFDPTRRPWIDMSAATTTAIMEQVKKCPSGALSYLMNEDNPPPAETATPPAAADTDQHPKIQIRPNGPIMVTDCLITHSNGEQEIKKGVTALCRCGASANKPFCDGAHNKINFRG